MLVRAKKTQIIRAGSSVLCLARGSSMISFFFCLRFVTFVQCPAGGHCWGIRAKVGRPGPGGVRPERMSSRKEGPGPFVTTDRWLLAGPPLPLPCASTPFVTGTST